jgi:hypothetical protein
LILLFVWLNSRIMLEWFSFFIEVMLYANVVFITQILWRINDFLRNWMKNQCFLKKLQSFIFEIIDSLLCPWCLLNVFIILSLALSSNCQVPDYWIKHCLFKYGILFDSNVHAGEVVWWTWHVAWVKYILIWLLNQLDFTFG